MNSKPAIFGAIILGILILGLVLWYVTEHPAPYINHPTATSTPAGTVGTASAPGHLTEHAAYYDIDTAYPTATPLKGTAGATADAKAIAIMKGFDQNSIDAFKEDGNFANLTQEDIHMQGLDQGRSYSLQITYKVYESAHTVSYVYVLYEDTLGAHPNSYYRTFTFDKKTGAGLELGDLFVPNTDFVTTLSTISRKLLPSIEAKEQGSSLEEVATQMITDGTTPDADNFLNWYVDGTNLVLVFPPYQVSAYALGTQIVTIPLSQLAIQPSYAK